MTTDLSSNGSGSHIRLDGAEVSRSCGDTWRRACLGVLGSVYMLVVLWMSLELLLFGQLTELYHCHLPHHHLDREFLPELGPCSLEKSTAQVDDRILDRLLITWGRWWRSARAVLRLALQRQLWSDFG